MLSKFCLRIFRLGSKLCHPNDWQVSNEGRMNFTPELQPGIDFSMPSYNEIRDKQCNVIVIINDNYPKEKIHLKPKYAWPDWIRLSKWVNTLIQC